MADFLTQAELDAALPHILAAPKDAAPVDLLCYRPDFGKRVFPDRLRLTRAGGIEGDRWQAHAWLRTEAGDPDPRIQVSILSKRVCDLVWRDRENVIYPGDSIIADLDLSEDNLPVGTLLQAGSAVLRVSDEFNDGCVKWKARYGPAAKAWITAPGHPRHRLRGILCSVELDGEVSLSDQLRKRD